MMRSAAKLWALTLLVAHERAAGHADECERYAHGRPTYYKKWRGNPKMVVFGDSNADSGRRFNAPASFDFEDIGPFPFTKLFVANDTDEQFRAYLPSPGSATNGRVWPDYLRVPEELNFATSSATASEAFRSIETCTGYTGEGEILPTATLAQQIDRYFELFVSDSYETLDYTHVIFIGGNDVSRVLQAFTRYSIADALAPTGIFGGTPYEDPVPFDKVFVNGQLSFEPVFTDVVTALTQGITRLMEKGVTGKILIANLASSKGVPSLVASELDEVLDAVGLAVSAAIQPLIDANPQLRLLDVFSLFASIIDNPEIFENMGFSEPEEVAGSPAALGTPCLTFNFVADEDADVMGTQALRGDGCQEEKCALCANGDSPCQSCLLGNPSADVCDDPNSRIFWDSLHLTTAFHQLFAEAVRQCAKDTPDTCHPWVETLCPTL